MTRRPAGSGLRASLARCVAAAFTVALAALLLARPAAAAGDPAIDWWTIETAHFHVHYPRDLEPIATRVALLVEAIHGRVGDALGYTPSAPTQIVVTDSSDSANGAAGSLPYNAIYLFVTAPDDVSVLNDYDDWLLDLVTHEFTHIAHVDHTSGIPAIVNAVLGKTISPNQLQPRWIIEGLAVVSESRHSSGGRMRSSLFDMYLRADVIEDRIAGIDQISSSPYRWPQGNLWYLYGSRFLGWVIDIYGPNTMRAVSADYGASLVPWGINRAIRRATGRTYVELYEGWKDHLRRLYGDQVAAVEARGVREGTRVTRHGSFVYYPRFIPRAARRGAADELIYFRDDTNARPGLYRMPLAAPPGGGERPEELVARTNGTSSAAFTPAGDLVFTSGAPFRNVYIRDDLFFLPRGEVAPDGDEPARRRITRGLRASAADVSPDGRSIAFSINSKGTRYLEIARIAPDGELTDRRDLVPSARFEQAFTPAFSPDGKRLAYSVWTAGGYRDIRVVDVATGRFTELTHDRAIDSNPVWSPDGKTLYFCSDRTGISNVYAYDVAAGTLRQVTNVRVGALQPAISPDGKTLVYVGYTSAGYDLFAMPLDPARFLAAPPPPDDRPDVPTQPPDIRIRRRRYNPWPTFAPRAFEFEIRPGKYGENAVLVSASGFDAVGNHGIVGQITIDPDAPGPDVEIAYSYGRLPVDLGLRLFHVFTPRGGYRINGQDLVYDERTLGFTSGVSYPIREEHAVHSLGTSFSVAAFKGELPVGSDLDPYARRTIDPPQGAVNVAHVGYAFSNIEGAFDASGAVRGVGLNMGFDYAGPATGSSYETYAVATTLTTYLPMPWPGHHTLALRLGGAVSGGTYPRGGTYLVGGYDLEGTSALTTITAGVFNTTFTIRGYEPRAFSGGSYYAQTLEYRFPLGKPDRGPSTLPIYLGRIDGSLFLDYGGAFDRFRFDDVKLFHDGYLIDSPQLHASVGGELWFTLGIGYRGGVQLRLGYAYGFSQNAIPDGQLYFVATNSF